MMLRDKIPVITLWPEWAYAICYLGKRVENRSWKPTRILGRRIAIHAGKHIGGKPSKTAVKSGLEAVHTMYAGANPGRELNITSAPIITSSIVATAIVSGCVHSDRHLLPWGARGQYQWVLNEVVVLAEPIPISGKQGIWYYPLTAKLAE
jgi:hypothetical protein